jgi:excisionase family DNA binding protein
MSNNNTEPEEPQLLLRADDVARLLSLGRARVYTLMSEKALPTVRIGRSVRVPAQALRAWLASRTTVPKEVA